MTKQQQLFICWKSGKNPDMTNRQLAEWAATEFNLSKAPVKSPILGILRSRPTLETLSADCLGKKECRRADFLQREAVLAEFVVRAENEGVPVSSGVVVSFARAIKGELGERTTTAPKFTRTGWP
ncbi:hypothetical protein PybrP1_002819 [[Pythium] brassicae (nom. inval.)]|nr:hypothetical protein PybrP1_002819 [[Pythium] brassicae (nom. inval.)]